MAERIRRNMATTGMKSSSSSSSSAAVIAQSQHQQQQRHAIVIGAGLSGLACARELEHSGWRVTILESRDRVGGRVWTETFLNGACVDIGASFIHGIQDNPIAEIALREGMDLHERLTCPLFDADGSPLNPDVDKYIEDEFNATLERAAKRKKQRKDMVRNESLEDALQASVNFTRNFTARDLRAFNWHLSNLEYSVNADLKVVKNDGWDADDPYGLDGAHCIVGSNRGMGAIAQSLADRLSPGAIRLNTAVKRIVYHPNGVKIEVVDTTHTLGARGMSTSEDTESKSSEADVTSRTRYERRAKSNKPQSTPLEDVTILQADVCICTVSLGVLKDKSISFCPELPKEKKAAIDNLGFGILNKVALLFPHKFWSDDCEIFGWCSEKRGDMPIFVDMSHDGHPILGILVSGTPAEKLEADSFRTVQDPQGEEIQTNFRPIVKRATDILRKIFKEIPPILETKVTRWRSDMFAHGSYSFVACDSSPMDYDVIASPVSSSRGGVPRLFFAGEATNRLFPASVHGAFFSGIREAQRLNRWFPLVRAKGSRNEPPATGDDRMCKLRSAKEGSVPQDVFWECFAPPFTFDQPQGPVRGKIILSKSTVPASVGNNGNVLSSPRAGGKRGRGLNATGAAATSISFSPVAKRTKMSLENVAQGDRLQISWKNGKYYEAWVSTLEKNKNGSVLAGVYYDDGSFETVDLAKEKWKPL